MLQVAVYTDGSCHTQTKKGAWVAILLVNNETHILSGKEEATSHNRMELTAVLKAFEYIKEKFAGKVIISVYSDSQYVVNLPERKEKLTATGFVTKKGNDLRNAGLIASLYGYVNNYTTEFIKVKAHQKNNGAVNYNIQADILSRRLMREL